jgi:hypothetical protein
VKMATTARNLGAIALLVSVFFVLALPGVSHGPFSYDEADYVYAANQGWLANWIDRPALNLVEFGRLGIESGRDIHRRLELSKIIRQSGDIHFYRHFHGPLFFDWLGLVGNWTHDEWQMRFLSLLIPAAGIVLVYCGCLWIIPSSQIIAVLASFLYATGYSVVGSPELAPHQLFAVASLANLFCLGKLEASRERIWWWWSCAWAAVSFVTLEVAFVNIAVLFVWAWRCRSILFPYKQFWLRSLSLFLAVTTVFWPAGIFKLEILRSYLFMGYLLLFRKVAWGTTPLLQTWQTRLRADPVEWLLVGIALIVWWFLPRKTEKYAAFPFLVYGALMFAVMFRINSTEARYVLPFLAPLLVFAGITLGAALQKWPKPLQYGMAGTMMLLVVAGTWCYVKAHTPPANSRSEQIVSSLRSRPLDGETLLAPQGDVSMLHYYFPRVNVAPYTDESSKSRVLSEGKIDAILSDENQPFAIEYLSNQKP